jgi:hypothetical protein
MTASTNHRKPARSRLAVLEAAQAKRRPTYAEPHQWAEEEWLTMFRKRADQGLYADEPEFPQALRAYEAALEAAGQQQSPPFFPPADYFPEEDDMIRRQRWRGGRHYSGVTDTIIALLEMTQRAEKARLAKEGQHAE